MCDLLWKIMTWCHHCQITLKARNIPGCLNVMADLLSRSNQVQSTKWSLHPQVFKQICQKWFTHVDLFATRLNHKVPRDMSPVPEQNAWDIGALNINWSGLTAYAYPPTALLHRVIQKVRQSKFLPKRPYLVRQRQQYVSGTSSSGTTSPRPFSSTYSCLGKKKGGTPAAAKS